MVERRVFPIGPFTKGAVDGANPALELEGTAKRLTNVYASGVGRLQIVPGTALAMTLKDDQGTPADVTSVLVIAPFGDWALAVAHSTVTDKFYLYRLAADFTGWYNSSDVLQSNLTAEPVGVLWSTATDPAVVTVAEGLGIAYIAHYNAGTSFPTKTYQVGVGIATLTEDLGGGSGSVYFRGVVSFQQHLWGWGHGYGTGSENDRPELLRYSGAFFAAFTSTDSIGVGHRVRSYREKVVAGVAAGEVLYVGTNYGLWPITGFGRNSWDKRPVDNSFGFAGPLSAVEGPSGWLYYWSHRGPMRARGVVAQPEPLFDLIPKAVAAVSDPSAIVAVYDLDRDQVLWLYADGSNSNRQSVVAAFDARREMFLGPSSDIGLGCRCAGFVTPVSVTGPAGPPTGASTTGVGKTIATANWTDGDRTAGTVCKLEYRVQGTSTWTVASATIPVKPTGANSFQMTGLNDGTDYEWRVQHIKGGEGSTWLGPSVNTQFTTSTLQPPSSLGVVCLREADKTYLIVGWINSGEEGVTHHLHWYGPDPADPGNPPFGTEVELPGAQSSYQLDVTDNLGKYYFAIRDEVEGTYTGWEPSTGNVSFTISVSTICVE